MEWVDIFISIGTQPPKATIGARMASVTCPSRRRQNLGNNCQNGTKRLDFGINNLEPTYATSLAP